MAGDKSETVEYMLFHYWRFRILKLILLRSSIPLKDTEKNKYPLCLFFQYFEELYADDPKKYQSYRISLYKRMIVCKLKSTFLLSSCYF